MNMKKVETFDHPSLSYPHPMEFYMIVQNCYDRKENYTVQNEFRAVRSFYIRETSTK